MMRNALKAGFTLIELLVTLILLGLLTAVVFPVVVQQIDDAEPTKAANDLANIKTGIEVFHLNVRPKWPGDLEDLVHRVDGTTPEEDADITGTAFGTNHETKWNGPYIDAAIPVGPTTGSATQETTDAVITGWGLVINNQVFCFDATPATNAVAVTCTEGRDFVALLIDAMTINVTAETGSEFEALDDLIDNGDGVDAGKIRAVDTDAIDANGNEQLYYLVAPYTG